MRDVSGRGRVCGGAKIIVCVCVCVCAEKGGGASTLVRHKNYARPLICLASCCAFVGEVNICGSVLIFRRLILMPATH